MDSVKQIKETDKAVLIFGAGQLFEENKVYLYENYNVIGFIDNDKGKQNTFIDGRKVFSLMKINDFFEYDEIIISSSKFYMEMVAQLISADIPDSKINSECVHKFLRINRAKYAKNNAMKNNMSVGKKSNKDFYTKQFYEPLCLYLLESARVFVPIVMEYLEELNVNSVIDFGCGAASMLSAFKENGVETILGIDGDYVDKSFLLIKPESFISYDLNNPIDLKQKFDLAMSMEVAEHIPEENAKIFVDSLCRHSDIILFSAAIPGQRGVNHINCQYPSYWANLFSLNGYFCMDIIRPRIWHDKRIRMDYRQNIMFYIKNNSHLAGLIKCRPPPPPP